MQKFNFKEFLSRYQDGVDDNELFLTLKELPNLSPDGPWLAGGALRRTCKGQPLDSDFDFFFKNEEQYENFCKNVKQLGFEETAKNEHNTTFAGTIAKKNVLVQAININFYDSIQDVLDSFDFTITQFGFDGSDLYSGEYALWDLARNKLALHRLTFGVSTVRRMIKYTKQGYTACQGTFVDILNSIVKNPHLIEEDIEYID